MAALSWIARSALLGLVVGMCIAQFAQQQQYSHNQFLQRPPQQQQQRQPNYFDQQQQQRQPNYFDQQQQQRRPNNYFNQPQQDVTYDDYAQPNKPGQQQPRRLPAAAASGSCPEPNGRFPVASQCDAYIECIDGVPEQKLCPEGLLFNPEARFNYPCGYPIDVQCLGRSNLQPAQPTEECPHQFGYFKMGDRQNCGKFMNCVDGRAFIFDCPEGLAYNPETYRCDWPDQVADCDAEAFLGFTCPSSSNLNGIPSSETKFYRSPTDCQHYYICVDGRPRLQNCGEGHAFNELIQTCDAAENVTGCEPSRSLNEDLQPVQLDQPQQSLRSFNQPKNYFDQQQQTFGSFNTQPRSNQQQDYRSQKQTSNPFLKQRFSSF